MSSKTAYAILMWAGLGAFDLFAPASALPPAMSPLRLPNASARSIRDSTVTYGVSPIMPAPTTYNRVTYLSNQPDLKFTVPQTGNVLVAPIYRWNQKVLTTVGARINYGTANSFLQSRIGQENSYLQGLNAFQDSNPVTRFLLFTPADALRAKTIPPLLTPEIQAQTSIKLLSNPVDDRTIPDLSHAHK